MNIKELIQDLVVQLRGHNALIQIQVDGKYVIKHIGDVNKLVDNPTLITYKEDSSFLDWMEGEIGKETYTAGTIANHKAALSVLRRYKEDMTFTQIDYKCICDFENFLKGAGYAINTIAKFMKIFRRFVNLAIDEELMTVYPFRKYHIKTENVQKQSLTERELRRIEDKEEKEELEGEGFKEAEQENNSQGSVTENAVPEEPAPDPTGTAASAPAQSDHSAPNPEDAVHAERELEMRGGSMSEPEISALLHERLVWVTATGRSVSRADTIAYRARAFTQQGSPAKQGVQVVDDHNVLIMAAVQTARGRVNRSSLWHYDTAAAPNGWRLRFRQETTAS